MAERIPSPLDRAINNPAFERGANRLDVGRQEADAVLKGRFRPQRTPQVQRKANADAVLRQVRGELAGKKQDVQQELTLEENLLQARIYNQLVDAKNSALKDFMGEKGERAIEKRGGFIKRFQDAKKDILSGLSPEDLNRLTPMADRQEVEYESIIENKVKKEANDLKIAEDRQALKNKANEIVSFNFTLNKDGDLRTDEGAEYIAMVDNFRQKVREDIVFNMGIGRTTPLPLDADPVDQRKEDIVNGMVKEAVSSLLLEAMDVKLRDKQYDTAKAMYNNFKDERDFSTTLVDEEGNEIEGRKIHYFIPGMTTEDKLKAKALLEKAKDLEDNDKVLALSKTAINRFGDNTGKMSEYIMKEAGDNTDLYRQSMGIVNAHTAAMNRTKQQARDNLMGAMAQSTLLAKKNGTLSNNDLHEGIRKIREAKGEGDYRDIRNFVSFFNMVNNGSLLNKVRTKPAEANKIASRFKNNRQSFNSTNFDAMKVDKHKDLHPATIRFFQELRDYASNVNGPEMNKLLTSMVNLPDDFPREKLRMLMMVKSMAGENGVLKPEDMARANKTIRSLRRKPRYKEAKWYEGSASPFGRSKTQIQREKLASKQNRLMKQYMFRYPSTEAIFSSRKKAAKRRLYDYFAAFAQNNKGHFPPDILVQKWVDSIGGV